MGEHVKRALGLAAAATAAILILNVLAPGLAWAGNGSVDLLDLPIEKPVRGRAVAPTPTPDPSQTPDPDPQEEPEPEPTPEPDEVPPEDPPEFFGEEIETPNDSIIYVIDRSGSMWLSVDSYVGLDGQIKVGGNRLDRAKVELKRSIAALADHFTFNIVFFDECVYRWSGQRVDATAANKSKAFAFIDLVQPAGWTNTGGAGWMALQDKENKSIVLLSDGEPNFLDCALNYVGTSQTHRAIIRGANTQGATINTFGIGLDSVTRRFMMNVAGDSGGSFVEVQ